MSVDTLLNIIFGIFNIAVVAMFFIYPWFKKYLVRKLFRSLKTFYDNYSILNPCLMYKVDTISKISRQLISQKLFYYGLPQNENVWEGQTSFVDNPFLLQKVIQFEYLRFWELVRLNIFWKRSNKKIKYIANVLNKFDYLVIENGSKVHTYKSEPYNNVWIDETSISISPTFDEYKLKSGIYAFIQNVEYKKVEIINMMRLKNKENKDIAKEIKSEYFSLNIRFKQNESLKPYNYSIYFEKGSIKNVTAFYEEGIRILDLEREEIQKIKFHAEWINNVFNHSIDDKVKRFEENFNKLRPEI